MKKSIYFLFAIALVVIFWSSCKRESPFESSGLIAEEPVFPAVDYNYNFDTFPSSGFGLSSKNINNKLAKLGRVLFYDKALSVSNNVACASCHRQELAFSDGLKVSTGFAGQQTTRNSMALFNLPMNGDYFWDLRRNSLHDMVLDPSMHLVEMGMESPNLLAKKVASIPYYELLFTEAFHDKEINSDRIATAITEFLSSLISVNSKFDRNNGIFTPQEERGRILFAIKQCASCHGGNNFNNQNIFQGNAQNLFSGGWGSTGGVASNLNINTDFANIGLEYSYPDPGMTPEKQHSLGISEVEQGLFKIPSLRNIALTGPYMHDGRFTTLEQVLDHYNGNLKAHKNIDSRLKINSFDPFTGTVVEGKEMRKLNLSTQDKADLIAFLHTLTDYNLISDPKYSNPFQPIK